MAQLHPAALARLLTVALLLAGCTATPTPTTLPATTAAAPASPTAAPSLTSIPPAAGASPTSRPLPTEPPVSPTPALPVDGWTGTVVKLCTMAQFEHYFQRDDGERYGIWSAAPDVEAQIVAARCAPGTVIRVWGTLETETIDVEGRRIVAGQVEVVSAPPTPAPDEGPAEEPVEGWRGRIVPLCSHERLDSYFERDDGVRFGLAGPRPEPGQGAGPVLEAMYIAECEGYPVRVWGTLYRGVDDYRGAQIVVNRIEKG